MEVNRQPGALPCGRALDDLYDHLAAGTLDEHERTCPHCREAAAALVPVQRATALARTEPPSEPGPGFVESVMSRVRAEARRSRALSLPAEPPLRLSISEHAAATLLSAAADTVPGVTSHGCRFPDPGDLGEASVAVSVRYGTSATEAAERVRQAVRTAARTQLGLTLHTIDVEVDDLDL
ncbi:hypothetical protein [Spirillospora sp. CA-294931]|uniref:hypothetical protein n=1 Tax=Spirillospora sp. CA-294931 TaxID=3240042 RepID=UPI003D90BF24